MAVVTGAGDGIGRAVAVAFAREGAAVVVNDVSDDAAQQVVEQIIAEGGKATAAVVAVGTSEAARAIVDAALDTFGDLHIVVNNAGVGGDSPIAEMPDVQIVRSIHTNLIGPMYLVREAVSRVIIPASYGRIINLRLAPGFVANPERAPTPLRKPA